MCYPLTICVYKGKISFQQGCIVVQSMLGSMLKCWMPLDSLAMRSLRRPVNKHFVSG
jgi:hypothetical protein